MQIARPGFLGYNTRNINRKAGRAMKQAMDLKNNYTPSTVKAMRSIRS